MRYSAQEVSLHQHPPSHLLFIDLFVHSAVRFDLRGFEALYIPPLIIFLVITYDGLLSVRC